MGKAGYSRAMKKIKRSGYWYVMDKSHPFSNKQGYIAEHRLIMEKHLGRFLKPGEIVHHINHDPIDNRIENLGLCENAGRHIADHHPEVMEKMRLSCVGKRPANWNREKRICEICGEKFMCTVNLPKRYCSRKCFGDGRKGVRVSKKTEFKKGKKPWNYIRDKKRSKKFEEVKCWTCTKPMRVSVNRIMNGRGRYCSRECMYKGRSNPFMAT